jgi:hypothetical protein
VGRIASRCGLSSPKLPALLALLEAMLVAEDGEVAATGTPGARWPTGASCGVASVTSPGVLASTAGGGN